MRWARAFVGLAEADPDAHALLAEALLASHDDAAAAGEFSKALASRPADPAFKRGLDRARRRAARSATPHPRAKASSAPATEATPAAADDGSDSPSGSASGSASGESAPEQ